MDASHSGGLHRMFFHCEAGRWEFRRHIDHIRRRTTQGSALAINWTPSWPQQAPADPDASSSQTHQSPRRPDESSASEPPEQQRTRETQESGTSDLEPGALRDTTVPAEETSRADTEESPSQSSHPPSPRPAQDDQLTRPPLRCSSKISVKPDIYGCSYETIDMM